jgi:hypothetical protein
VSCSLDRLSVVILAFLQNPPGMLIGVGTSALQRYGAPEHRSEPHSRMEDWLVNLPASVYEPSAVGNGFAPLHANLKGARSARRSQGCRWPGSIYEAAPDLFCDSSNPLLRRQDRDLLGPHDRRRIPFAGQCFGLRSIEAQAKVEGPFGRRKPVGLLFCTWALVLKI